MTDAQRIFLHINAALTAVTGLLFALFKYAMKSDDPFAVANHPLQPFTLDAHVVVAPLLVFGFGWIFSDHIWPKFRLSTSQRRTSGVAMLGLMAPMTLSGYLLQVATNDSFRQSMAILHWTASGVFVLGYVTHLLTKR